MTLRTAALLLSASLAAAAMLIVLSCAPAGPAPGVILIVVDAMRADHLGAYGYERDTSPHMDALAAKGVVFENTITQASFSGPSYATILTGKLPQEHGVRDHPRVLDDDANETLAEAATRQGFRTAGFVAHSFLDRRWKYDQGFQDYQKPRPVRGRHGHTPPAERVVDAAIDWLEHITPEQPFFVFVQLQEAHMPYLPPAPHDTLFGEGLPGTRAMRDIVDKKVNRGELMFSFRELGYDDADLAGAIALYDGEIRYADEQLGRLFDVLESAGRLDTTVIAITADHGESLGEQDLYFHHDMSLYEPVARVPLIVHAPGKLPANTRTAGQVRLVDLVPTLAELAGIDPPRGVSGQSMVPVVRGEKPGPVAFAENQPFKAERADYPHYRVEVPGVAGKWRMVRTNSAKLIRIPTADGITWELYDLETDPEERVNLHGQRPELESELRDLLEAHLAADPNMTDEPVEPELDDATREQLRSLGYLE